MRDIGDRIQRHRLTRYAVPSDPVGRHVRWIWLVLAAWLLYAGVLSEHSFYRLWRLGREARHVRERVAAMRQEIDRIDAERRDPSARRERAERLLRERGRMAREGERIYLIEGAGGDSLQP